MAATTTDSKSSNSKRCSRKAVYSVNLYEQTDTTMTVKHVSRPATTCPTTFQARKPEADSAVLSS
jgi:hypothetical protein